MGIDDDESGDVEPIVAALSELAVGAAAWLGVAMYELPPLDERDCREAMEHAIATWERGVLRVSS